MRIGDVRFLLWSTLVVVAAAALFVVPGLQATGGIYPVPLDDPYIYFCHAKAAARGAPFSWIAGQGYSSGATGLPYPFVLAPLYAIGFRGLWLPWAAGGVAVVALVDASRQLARVVPHASLRWFLPIALVAVPLTSWSLFSGMEVALFTAFAARMLGHVASADRAEVAARRGAQWRGGMAAVLMVLTRPESLALAVAVAIAGAYRGRRLSAPSSLLRLLSPTALGLAATMTANLVLTGAVSPAGGIHKLIVHDPFVTRAAAFGQIIVNLFTVLYQAVFVALGQGWSVVFVVAIAVGLKSSAKRPLVLALCVGAVGQIMLACLTTTVRYQNYRTITPALWMVVVAALLGLCRDDRGGRRTLATWGRWALAVACLLAPASRWRRERDHFARASRNIVQQHVALANYLNRRDPPARSMLLNDAGVLPYLTDLSAVDGLGLGGRDRLPFARAARLGSAATVELIERLQPQHRPDVLVGYAGWWRGVLPFATREHSVTIDDNVIAPYDEKTVYTLDWSTLESWANLGTHDAVDFADLVDEDAHDFVSNRTLRVAGRVARSPRERRMVYDGGRKLEPGDRITLLVKSSRGAAAARAATVWLRLSRCVPLEATLQAEPLTFSCRQIADDTFAVASAAVPTGELARRGSPLTLSLSTKKAVVIHHLWLERAPNP